MRRGQKLTMCQGPECKRGRFGSSIYCKAHRNQTYSSGTGLKPLRIRMAPFTRDSEGRKQCVHCLKWKSVELFGRQVSRTDGLTSWCRRCSKSSELQRNYNLTIDQYDELLAKQGGGCAICGKTESDDGRMLAVDHDHKCCSGSRSCGKCVRALLCVKHNSVLGFVGDDPSVLQTMIDYLNQHEGESDE